MNQKVRCKVQCNSILKQTHTEFEKKADGSYDYAKPVSSFRYTAKFQAVCDGSPENKVFWEFTPSGQIEFSTIKADVYEVGKFYYVDFSLASE